MLLSKFRFRCDLVVILTDSSTRKCEGRYRWRVGETFRVPRWMCVGAAGTGFSSIARNSVMSEFSQGVRSPSAM